MTPMLSRADNPAAVMELPAIEVVSTTPVPGLGIPLEQVPANVQIINAKQIDDQHAAAFSDLLDRNLGSINLSDTQASPLQMDVNFRGFTASPILGTPQGLSVFVDGVRVNEAFGDTVNWDLLPNSAISSIMIMPGSNPVFGLNTLGGSVSINTKSGFEFPGTKLTLLDGSFNRRTVDFETGGHGKSLDYFLAASFMNDGGWAFDNPSQVRQLFGKSGYQDDTTDLDVSYAYADNHFSGNQTIPLSFMNNLSQPYTWPDNNHNMLSSVNARGSQFLDEHLLLGGNAYYRSVDTSVFNSNAGGCGQAADGILVDQSGQACNVGSYIDQTRTGGSIQLTSTADRLDRGNTMIAGLNFDHGMIRFNENFQSLATMPASRNTVSSLPQTPVVDLQGYTNNMGLYLTDNLALNQKTFLVLSGRYDRATVKLSDMLGSDLNGQHSYSRINPSAGITYNPDPTLTTYVNYNQGMRVPTPVELGCANPAAPCALPNAFASDPELKAVTSSTWEMGARGKLPQGIQWNLAMFNSLLNNDIQYIGAPTGTPNVGYFANVGQTQRRGIEMEIKASRSNFNWHADYTFLDATYLNSVTMNNSANSSANSNGAYLIQPGDRIPGLPRHLFKAGLNYLPMDGLDIGILMLSQSSQYARGDENNLDVNGPLPGFTIFNLDSRYRLNSQWEIFAKVDNLFNRHYSSYAQLGNNVFTGSGQSYNPGSPAATQFRSIAPPFGAWLGMTWYFDGPGARNSRPSGEN